MAMAGDDDPRDGDDMTCNKQHGCCRQGAPTRDSPLTDRWNSCEREGWLLRRGLHCIALHSVTSCQLVASGVSLMRFVLD